MAPIPSASESTAVAVNEGLRRKDLAEKRRSYTKSRSHRVSQTSRTSSRTCVRPPSSSAACPASFRFRTDRMHQIGDAAVQVIAEFAIEAVFQISAPEPVEYLPHSPALVEDQTDRCREPVPAVFLRLRAACVRRASGNRTWPRARFPIASTRL